MGTAKLCHVYFFSRTNLPEGWAMPGNPAIAMSRLNLPYYPGGQVFSESMPGLRQE
jgi:hypothetical protein